MSALLEPSDATKRMCVILGARWVPNRYAIYLRILATEQKGQDNG